MIADCFSEPLSGSLFKKMRNLVLGINDTDMGVYMKAFRESTKQWADRTGRSLNKMDHVTDQSHSSVLRRNQAQVGLERPKCD